MTAKDFLWSIRSEDLELKTLGEQIKHTRQEAEGVRAMQLSDMPKGGKGVDVAALLAEVVDLQTIYFEKARAIVRKRKLATDIIMTMDSVEQKSVLSLRYLCGKSWDDIVDIMHYATAVCTNYTEQRCRNLRKSTILEKEWSKVE